MSFSRATEFLESQKLPPMELIYGRSSAMAAARERLDLAARTSVPVLLQGESGTGKDIFAKLLHGQSTRSDCPWVKVTCPAIPHALIESELFGYERGAFTGASSTKRGRVELAHRGTLFLDEVGSLDMSVQAKLLQLLQDGTFMRLGGQESRKVDARLICASSDDLREQTALGSFRRDFFFRINAVTINLPPLRNRVADLPLLIDYFLNFHSKAYRCEPKPLSRETSRMMQRYDWPGNIRQLENMIRSYVLLGNEEALIAELVPTIPEPRGFAIDLATPVSLKQITKNATRELEREIIFKVLQANGWNRQKTAKWLKISYRSLLYKLQETSAGTLPAQKPGASLSSGAERPGTVKNRLTMQ